MKFPNPTSAPRPVASGGMPQGFRGFWLWFALLFVITQLPLYAVEYPSIVDLPNHVARLHVLMHLKDSTVLQGFYEEKPGMSPNMALDVLALPLARAFGPQLALKLFASGCTLLLASGTVALGAAVTRRLTMLSLGSLLFAQNAFTHLGLFNFLFGIGLALWLLAAWIVSRRRNRSSLPLLTAFAGGATLLYLCHLAALGVYLVCLVSFEMTRVASGSVFRRLGSAAKLVSLQAVPALAIHLLAYEPGTNSGLPASGSSILVIAVYKLVMFSLVPSITIHDQLVAMVVMIPCITFAVYRGLKGGWLWVPRSGAFMIGGLALRMLLLPPSGFGSNMVDIRLALPLVLIAWASLSARTIRFSSLASAQIVTAITLGVAVASAATWYKWSASDAEYRELRKALLQVETGSTLAAVSLDSRTEMALSPHAAAWGVVDRSVFLSSFFLRPYQPFILAFRPELVSLARIARLDNDAGVPTLSEVRLGFDYALVFGPEMTTADYAADATTLFVSAHARLLRLASPIAKGEAQRVGTPTMPPRR